MLESIGFFYFQPTIVLLIFFSEDGLVLKRTKVILPSSSLYNVLSSGVCAVKMAVFEYRVLN